ncbi:CLUMA_CG013715, isoform A [Clunio marinus]|uniref:CLUMA_CG013715, isoform A n=1 Tax=Clunio marinus TaxID=568069 RepID=A0A1J1ILL0_9DIPT|nr:CLUMA_CG013715, isoform A [Clunio marinus]
MLLINENICNYSYSDEVSEVLLSKYVIVSFQRRKNDFPPRNEMSDMKMFLNNSAFKNHIKGSQNEMTGINLSDQLAEEEALCLQ